MKNAVVRSLRAVFISGALVSIFVFIHRVVLDVGGSITGNWMVTEDSYGPVLFLLFFGGLLLFPLPQKHHITLSVLRSVLLTAGATFSVNIMAISYPRHYFNADGFLIMVSVLFLGSFLLLSRPFR